MSKYRIKSYETNVSRRCWGCCQENCQSCSCSCHTEKIEVRYALYKGNRLIERGFKTPDSLLKDVARRINNEKETIVELEDKIALQRKRLRQEIKILEDLDEQWGDV